MHKLSTILLLSSLLVPDARAATPAEQGLAIAQEMDRRDTGFKDLRADLTMTLRNRQGDQTSRRLRTHTLEVNGDGDKSLIIFDSPADVKGTSFLSYTHATRPDDQWLYLPALKRVKRIASSNKSGPFIGSEFAYEDLTSQEVDKYSYKFLRDDMLDGHATLVMERFPAYEHSGYARQVVWVDKEMYQPLKLEFYDRKNSLLKTLKFNDYKKYLDRYWRPGEMHMENHQTGKTTLLKWENYQFRNGYTDRDFDQNSLKRAQ